MTTTSPTPPTARTLPLVGILITLIGLGLIALTGARMPQPQHPARTASMAVRAYQPAAENFAWMLDE